MIDGVPSSVLTIASPEVGRASWIADAARKRGILVAGFDVLGKRYYWGGPRWAAAHAEALGVALLEPDDAWLSDLPRQWLRRSVRLTSLAEATQSGRAFIKPPRSKAFPPRIYNSSADLAAATEGLPPETPALVSDPVEFAAEYRLFVLDGTVHTGSRYASWGMPDPGTLLTSEAARVCSQVEEMLQHVRDTLPSAVVIDAGLLGPPDAPRRDIAIVEASMAWFAQPYWSEPERVLDVVMRAAGPKDRVTSHDSQFVRETQVRSSTDD